MKTKLILVISLFALGSCKDLGTNPPVASSLDDIREAVFRHQILYNYSGLQQNALAYFIGIYVAGDSTKEGYYVDPSENLMARFRGESPPVKKASECNYSMNGVFDRVTGNQGLLFRIESIREIGKDEVEVQGGYFEVALSASGNLYTVQRIGNRWVVIKDVLIWIS